MTFGVNINIIAIKNVATNREATEKVSIMT